jgi:carbon storage regulator
MLVLARKKGESIMIGDSIEVVVLGAEGEVVKIGINAPKEIPLYRKEIYESILQTNREASLSSVDLESLTKIFKEGQE